MKYPKIPKAFLKTEVELTIKSDETGTDGKAITLLHKKFKCNYQSVNTKNSSDLERSALTPTPVPVATAIIRF